VFQQGGLVAPLATAAEEPPAPAAAAAPIPVPVESEFEPEPSARIFAAAEPEPGLQVRDLAELFGQPDKRNWDAATKFVQKTSELPGVSGALIALQDGLLVASCMPPEWKTETVAAFLPQIFGRMHQIHEGIEDGANCTVSLLPSMPAPCRFLPRASFILPRTSKSGVHCHCGNCVAK